MGNVYMEASQINYRGGEKKMSVEEALKNTSGEAAAIAQLQTDVANLNGTKANQITIAPFFNDESSYDPGDLVYYNGLTYRCVNAHEGEWDADDFAATTISNEIDSLKSGLTNLVKVDHKTGTTDSSGDFNFTLPSGGKTLISVRPLRDSEYYSSWWGVTLASTHNNIGYSAKAIKDDGTALASQSIKYDVYYI